MKKISTYEKRVISEVADVKSFIIIYCDSPLPCAESETGTCEGGHEIDIATHKIDHQHAVQLLKQARELVMHEGLK